MIFSEGQILFAKRISSGIDKGSTSIELNGHAIVMLLGHVPKGQSIPTQDQVDELIRSIGLVGIDDIAKHLGEDQAKKLVDALEKMNLEIVR